jgi:Cytochrome c7 and related cytochrome c
VRRVWERCARVPAVTVQRWVSAVFGLCLLEGACGGPAPPTAAVAKTPASPLGARRADIPDDCEVEAGKPPPEPLRIRYTGVAKAARCQRAVYTIMGGVTHFLGVECRYCHLEPDYAADTHNKQIANWMARELVPRLQKRAAGPSGSKDVWCVDCHAGKSKFLGDPRRRDVAIEWMTTHLAPDFDTTLGKPPKCKECHGGDLGSPEFRSKIILGELAGLPAPVAPAAEPAPLAPAAAPSAAAVPSAQVVPDFGKR